MHWYTQDGSPAHFQKDGSNTTLRHARKQELVPSVTGILDIVDKPGLTNYLINQHLEAAWDSEQNPDIDYADWCKEVRQKAREHSENARDKGSFIHKALDIWYSDSTEEIPPEYNKYINAVSAALEKVYGIKPGDLLPEATFATKSYGGAVDLSGNGLVIDYKTKADSWDCKKDGTPKKMWYESHVGQLAAYREGLGMPEAKCINVFIGPDAEVYIHEWPEDEVVRGMEYFNACYELWRIKNRYG